MMKTPTKKTPLFTAALLLFSLCLLGLPGQAGAITVSNLNDSGAGSLRQAIIDANNNAGTDVIDFAPGLSGTIALTTSVIDLSALPVVTESVQILGPGPAVITIDASAVGDERVFLLDDGAASVSTYEISGLTITGGNAHDNIPATSGGGAIYLAEGDTLALSNCVITLNKSTGAEGGAIRLGPNTNVTIDQCDIHDNESVTTGGGISNFHTNLQETGSLIIQNSSIRNNRALGSVVGGIARLGGTLMILNSSVSGNEANTSLGGIAMNDPGDGASSLTIENSSISNNKALNGNFAGFISGATTNTILNSTISGNEATGGSGGGAVFSFIGTANIVNSTISGNTATNNGGGLNVVNGGVANLFNVTISENSADSDGTDSGDGGGLVVQSGATVNVSNSIIAGNFDPTSAPDCSGTVTSAGYNLVGNNENCDFVENGTDQVGTPGSPIDPMLAALGDNGGPTQTQALMDGSPAIDMGDPNGCLDQNGTALTTDQRGEPRPGTGSTRCDVGAYEFQANVPPPPPPPDTGGCHLTGTPHTHPTHWLLGLGLLSALYIIFRKNGRI